MFIFTFKNTFKNIYSQNLYNLQQSQSFGKLFWKKGSTNDCFTRNCDSNLSVLTQIYGKDIYETSELSLKKTDKKVPAYITRDEYDDLISLGLYVEKNGCLGKIILQRPEQAENVCCDSSDFFRDLSKKAMYIYYLYSENDGYGLSQYRGIGTELIKSAIKESSRNGYNGRLVVSAANGNVSPVPFYYKCGFRFEDSKLNKSMDVFFHSKSNKLPPDLFAGIMYLSDKNAESLLLK